MKSLGAENFTDKGSYIIFPTICHNIDVDSASMKLYYYKNSHIFMCYTECGSQSIFKLLKNYYETRNIEYDWYNDIYKVICDCSTFSHQQETPRYKKISDKYHIYYKEKSLPIYNEGALDCFLNDYFAPEWLNDGISVKAMKKFNIRYSISQNKIIIPHYSADG